MVTSEFKYVAQIIRKSECDIAFEWYYTNVHMELILAYAHVSTTTIDPKDLLQCKLVD